MPEDNFEQQARRKAEEFGMEPKPEVWLHVKAAIAQPERRRRILLWWWLLPLCLAGAVAAWVVGDRKSSSEMSSVAVSDKSRLGKKEAFSFPKQKGEETGKTDAPVEKTDRKKRDEGLGKASGKQAGAELSGHVYDSIKRSFLPSSVESKTNSRAEISKVMITEAGNGIMKKNAEEANTLIAKKPDIIGQDKTGNQPLMVITDSTDKINEIKADTTVVATNRTLPDKTVAGVAVKQKTKAKKKSWQTGVTAEAGLTSWGKDLLYNEVGSTGSFNDISQANTATRDSVVNNTSAFQQTKNGVAVAVGFVVRKEMQNHFYIEGQLGYRYQQYKVYNLLKSLLPQPALSDAYFVNKDNYHTHFISFTVSAGRHLLTYKRNSLSAEAGIDNSLLFMMNQQNAKQSSVFSLNKSLTTSNFYRWQPHLVVSLPFDWHPADKARFLVSPFARFGLHTFQKNGNDYKNNHTVSAGVQAVYFFR